MAVSCDKKGASSAQVSTDHDKYYAHAPSCTQLRLCLVHNCLSGVSICVCGGRKHERSYHVNCTRSRSEVRLRRVQCEAWILFVLLMLLSPHTTFFCYHQRYNNTASFLPCLILHSFLFILHLFLVLLRVRFGTTFMTEYSQ